MSFDIWQVKWDSRSMNWNSLTIQTRRKLERVQVGGGAEVPSALCKWDQFGNDKRNIFLDITLLQMSHLSCQLPRKRQPHRMQQKEQNQENHCYFSRGFGNVLLKNMSELLTILNVKDLQLFAKNFPNPTLNKRVSIIDCNRWHLENVQNGRRIVSNFNLLRTLHQLSLRKIVPRSRDLSNEHNLLFRIH